MSEPQTAMPHEQDMPREDELIAAEAAAQRRREEEENDRSVEREIGQRTRRSLLVGGAAALLGAGAWEWLRTRRPDGGIPWPLRIGLRWNEELTRDYFSDARLTPTFAPSRIEAPRPNGDVGLDDDSDPNQQIVVEGVGDAPLSLTLDAIKSLPKVEEIVEFKCIEGWSLVLKWGGVRFRDFIAKYAPKADPNGYVALQTPDGAYYVGLEMAAAMHPQTLLAYEINGQPLPDEHGAPLRLAIPLKYGVKNLKRIGKIAFTNDRPPDYWAERGYDWYAGF